LWREKLGNVNSAAAGEDCGERCPPNSMTNLFDRQGFRGLRKTDPKRLPAVHDRVSCLPAPFFSKIDRNDKTRLKGLI
jgi:hypothetical protein